MVCANARKNVIVMEWRNSFNGEIKRKSRCVAIVYKNNDDKKEFVWNTRNSQQDTLSGN